MKGLYNAHQFTVPLSFHMVRADARSAPQTNPCEITWSLITQPGKLAELVILSENPCEVDPRKIRNIKVEPMIIGVETVFQAG